MEERTFTIKLADDTSFDNLALNGNCFISETPITREQLSDDKLLEVDINGEKHHNMVCTNLWTDENDGSTWFIIRDKTEDELKALEINAKLDFLMAMQGVM